jgi:uncharacterized damage-inducible protein DinB
LKSRWKVWGHRGLRVVSRIGNDEGERGEISMTFRSLEALYSDKERVLGTLEETVRSLSDSQLAFRPSPEAWSVAEIVEHLAIVEPGMLKVVGSLLEKAVPPNGSSPEAFEVTLDDGIRTGGTGKFKTRPEAVPTGSVPAGESLQTLGAIQSGLRALRHRLAAVDVSSVKFPHRALGDLTLGQWCAFIGAHEARHLGQIRSVISSAGFPR